MNLLDLAFKHDITIHHEPDFDGGDFYITMDYLLATYVGVTEAKTTFALKQQDIDELCHGAKKLVKLLEKYVTEGY